MRMGISSSQRNAGTIVATWPLHLPLVLDVVPSSSWEGWPENHFAEEEAQEESDPEN